MSIGHIRTHTHILSHALRNIRTWDTETKYGGPNLQSTTAFQILNVYVLYIILLCFKFFDMSFCCLKRCVFCNVYYCFVKCSVSKMFYFLNCLCNILHALMHIVAHAHMNIHTHTQDIESESESALLTRYVYIQGIWLRFFCFRQRNRPTKKFTCQYTTKHKRIDMQTFMHMYNK